MRKHRSIGHQAAIRLVVSLGLLVILIAASSIGIYQAALHQATHEHTNELINFYTGRLDQIEREWEIRSRDFKLRIEITRMLEDPSTATVNLQAFMTIQGADRPFQYLIIQTEEGKKLFDFGTDINLPSIPRLLDEGFPYYQDPGNRQLYRVFQLPIWLGAARGMGRFAAFILMDNALLRQMSTPGLTLSVVYHGQPVASSDGQKAIDRLRHDHAAFNTSDEVSILPWGGRATDPVHLLLESPVTTLFSTTELSVGVSIIPILDGSVLWFTIGLWLLRQMRRITHLGAAVEAYSADQRITDTLSAQLVRAALQQRDEITEVAEALDAMMHSMEQRAQEQEATIFQVRSSEAFLRELTSAMADGVLLVDRNGTINFVNPRAEWILGWSANELLGRDSHETLHSLVPFENCRVHAAIRNGQAYYVEEDVFVRHDGRQVPIMLSAAPLRRDGNVIGAVVTFQDITERKRILTEYRSIFQTSRDGFWIISSQHGGFLDANPIACRMLGYELEELQKMCIADIEVDESPEETWRHMQAIKHDRDTCFEARHRHRDGHIIEVEVSAQYLEVRGGIFVVFVRDITESRRSARALQNSEARFRQMFENMRSGVAIYTAVEDGEDFTFRDMNPSVERIEGLGRELVIGKRVTVVFPGIREMGLLTVFKRVWQTGNAEDFPLGFYQDGRISGWRDNFVYRLPSGEVVAIYDDVTEKKRVEEALLEAKNEADRANRAKSIFLSNMSHEIRTPLNAILGLAYLLEHTKLTLEQRTFTTQMSDAGRNLLLIINDVLDFSRVEAGKLEFEHSEFFLSDLINAVSSIMSVNAGGKALKLVIRVDDNVPNQLIGDSLRLQQILNNLIGNAAKFTDQGEIVLLVQPISMNDSQITLRFSVSDTGSGIPPEAQKLRFTSFHQADRSTTRRYGGSGLGLAICKKLVEQMEGEIGCESQIGVGSTFWFTLSFALGTAPCDESMTTRTMYDTRVETHTHSVRDIEHLESEQIVTPRLQNLLLLLVEDNNINQDVARRILELEEAKVAILSDGQQAVDMLTVAPHVFDAVLMDIHMPVMDGYQTTQYIRNDLGLTDLPIIAMTAGVLSNERELAHAAGMNGFITKPFVVDQLVQMILRYVKSPGTAPYQLPKGGGGVTPSWNQRLLLTPEIVGIDMRQASLRLGGDEVLFGSLLTHFSQQFSDTIARVRDELMAGNPTNAAIRLHTLRGAAGNLSATEVMTQASVLEAALREKRESDVPDWCERRVATLGALIDSIRKSNLAVANSLVRLEHHSPSHDVILALLNALETNNGVAVKYFDRLRAVFTNTYGEDTVNAIAQSIDNLEFGSAAKQLRTLLNAGDHHDDTH